MVTVLQWLLEWQTEIFYWLLFTLVLGAERYLPLPAHFHPATALHTLAVAMAAKVHRPARSRSQQRIAGLMAVLTLLAPWLVIAALLLWMTELKWLFNALVLYLCLGSTRAASCRIELALQQGQKQLAREHLQPFVQRDCQTLSATGIRKANAEASSRRLLMLWLAPLFWFFVGGPLAALAYRMLYDLATAWPVMRSKWQDFGLAASELIRSLAWPAVFIGWVILFSHRLLRGRILPWSSPENPYLHRQDAIWWRALAANLQIRLSGTVILNGKRCSRPCFNYSPHELTAEDMRHFQNYLRNWQLVIWLLCSLILLTGLVEL